MSDYRKKQGGLIGGIAIALVLILAVGALGFISSGFRNWDISTWFKKPDKTPGIGAVIGVDGNSNDLVSGKIYPMPKTMAFTRSEQEFNAMGITTQSAVTLQATIQPEFATNKTANWSVAWVNPVADWAVGKTVASYLTVTPTSDGALTATVNCLQSFGEKIKITVTSRSNEVATAECTVDYARRISSTQLNVSYANPERPTFSFTTTTQSLDLYPVLSPQVWYQIYGAYSTNCINEFVYTTGGNYTVNNEVLSTVAEIKASTELINALNTQGMTPDCVDWQTLSTASFADIIFSLGGTSSLSNSSFLNVTNYNKLLTAFSATVSSDFQLRITVTTRYGDPVVTTYTCHYSHASAGLAVTSVTLGSDTLIV
jgi:hypothetical protein